MNIAKWSRSETTEVSHKNMNKYTNKTGGVRKGLALMMSVSKESLLLF